MKARSHACRGALEVIGGPMLSRRSVQVQHFAC